MRARNANVYAAVAIALVLVLALALLAGEARAASLTVDRGRAAVARYLTRDVVAYAASGYRITRCKRTSRSWVRCQVTLYDSDPFGLGLVGDVDVAAVAHRAGRWIHVELDGLEDDYPYRERA